MTAPSSHKLQGLVRADKQQAGKDHRLGLVEILAVVVPFWTIVAWLLLR